MPPGCQWTLFLELLCILATVAICQSLAGADLSLMPDDPVVEEGDVLNLTCTLNERYNSSLYGYRDIYFMHDSTEYRPPQFVLPVAPRSSLLIVPNVTMQLSGHVFCCLPDKCRGHFPAAVQSVSIYRRPLQPTITDCEIHDWNVIVCGFEPSDDDQKSYTHSLQIKYRMQWKAERLPTVVYESNDCYTQPLQCEVKLTSNQSSTLFDGSKCVRIIASNKLKIDVASTYYCFQPQKIVALEEVGNVKIFPVNASHVNVTWLVDPSAERPDVQLVFKVTATSEWHSESFSSIVINCCSYTFNVTPFTSYNISVYVKTIESDIWSSPAVASLRTNQSVPNFSPKLHAGGFQVVDGDSGEIRLYWKPVPLHLHNGPGFHYMVMRRDLASDEWSPHAVSVAGNSTSEVVTVSDGEQLTVVACNSNGCTEPSNSVWFPTVMEDTLPELIVEGDVHFATLRAHYAGSFNLTAFWCRSTLGRGICADEIEWLRVGSDETEYNVSLTERYQSYIFGVAAVSFNAGAALSNGIHWTSCVYNRTALASSPKDLRATVPSSGTHGELLVTWKQPTCSQGQGYITTYALFYCEIDENRLCRDNASVVLVSGNTNRYSLTSLKHGSLYRLWMYSVTRRGYSFRPSNVTVETAAGVKPLIIFGIVVAVVMLVVFLTLSVVACCRHYRRLHRKFVAGISVKLPSASNASQGIMMNNLSPAPVVEYSRIAYSRQGSRLSSSSHDSGHMVYGGSPSVSPNVGSLTSPLLPKQCTGHVANTVEPTGKQLSSDKVVDRVTDGVGSVDVPTGRHATSNQCYNPLLGNAENCCVQYVNNNVSSQRPAELDGSYSRLITGRTVAAGGHVNSDLSECSCHCNNFNLHPNASSAAAAAARRMQQSSSTENVSLTESNRDSGYVQHNVWLHAL